MGVESFSRMSPPRRAMGIIAPSCRPAAPPAYCNSLLSEGVGEHGKARRRRARRASGRRNVQRPVEESKKLQGGQPGRQRQGGHSSGRAKWKRRGTKGQPNNRLKWRWRAAGGLSVKGCGGAQEGGTHLDGLGRLKNCRSAVRPGTRPVRSRGSIGHSVGSGTGSACPRPLALRPSDFPIGATLAALKSDRCAASCSHHATRLDAR